MLIIDSKDCENIDKALKKYKKKFEKSKVLLQLRERQSFIKPSVRRRGQVLKAIYKQKYCQWQDRRVSSTIPNSLLTLLKISDSCPDTDWGSYFFLFN